MVKFQILSRTFWENVNFNLYLDESTNIADISQFLIFVRTKNEDFEIHDELFGIEIIRNQKKVLIYSIYLMMSFLNMMKTMLVRLCKEIRINCLFFHCIIHHEILSEKIIRLSETIKTAINTINFIRKRQ